MSLTCLWFGLHGKSRCKMEQMDNEMTDGLREQTDSCCCCYYDYAYGYNYDCYYNYCCYHCCWLLDIVGFFGNEITFPQNGAVEGLRA